MDCGWLNTAALGGSSIGGHKVGEYDGSVDWLTVLAPLDNVVQ